MWVTTTPVDDVIHAEWNQYFDRYSSDLNDYSSAAATIMNENNIPIIDLFSFTKNIDGKIYSDHVHFNKNVQKLQAAFIAGALSNLF